jgi:hypothetical protein
MTDRRRRRVTSLTKPGLHPRWAGIIFPVKTQRQSGSRAPGPIDAEVPDEVAALRELACVAHIHSTHSDGRARVGEILATARAAGRDAVLLTDHDTLGAARVEGEGWHDDVLLVVGHEVSPRGGHLLVFGAAGEIGHDGRDAAAISAMARRAGAVAIAAHPFSSGSAMSRRIGRPHPWPIADPSLDGIELWCLITDSAEAWRGPWQALRFLRSPERTARRGPPEAHLRSWDELCARRPTVAIAGLDAHESGIPLPGGRMLTAMPNRRYFGLLGTYVLTAPADAGDRRPGPVAVVEALRAGRCYVGVDALAPASGFRFWAERDGDPIAQMGEQVGAGDWVMHAVLSRPAQLRLLHNGNTFAAVQGKSLRTEVAEPGAYRVEALLPWQGRPRRWVISNPIYLR